MIERTILKTIEESIIQSPVTVLSGPRQVGKSTLVYNEFAKKGFSYVGLDDVREKSTAKSDPISFLQQHPYPLIIDEAQKAKELFPEIERIVNRVRLEKGSQAANGMYILSGSNSKALLDDAKESLAGRANILKMPPLSMREIQGKKEIPFYPDKISSENRSKDFLLSEDELLKYIVRGFMPELYDNPSKDTTSFYSSYLQTYLERDLPDVLEIKDEIKFENFLLLLASNTGEELVYENYSSQVGVSSTTIKTWIDTLSKMGIVYLVFPYNENSITKRVVKRPKMYFFDTGLACFLAGIRDSKTLKLSFLKGRFVETYFFNEIRKSYLNFNDDIPLYYYRDTNQNEIDLVLVKNGTISSIEFKSGVQFSLKDIEAFNTLKSSKLLPNTNCILCTTDKPYSLSKDTIVLPASGI
jgi:predicted AAA+ superfamily ATPase